MGEWWKDWGEGFTKTLITPVIIIAVGIILKLDVSAMEHRIENRLSDIRKELAGIREIVADTRETYVTKADLNGAVRGEVAAQILQANAPQK